MATGSDDEGTLVVNCLDLHEMFRIVGDQMTEIDIKILKYLYNGIMPNGVIDRVKDGYDFLLGLEMMNRVDETNFKYVLDLLRMITRHDLLQYVSLRRRRAVQADPVSEYLEQAAAADSSSASSSKRNGHLTNQSKRSHTSCGTSDDVPVKCRRKSLQRAAKTKSGLANTIDTSTGDAEARPSCSTAQGRGHGEPAPRVPTNGESSNPNSFMFSSRDSMNQDKKVTCDIRLRVRAEYCHHTNALEGNVFSNKPHLIERQFEKFMQANTILKSRDLGSIICDIKFTELTYLDAFWRDYINGSLLEALKGVFITDSLKQAVGNEAIKLLVSVDEDDYEAGRVKLLKNLQI